MISAQLYQITYLITILILSIFYIININQNRINITFVEKNKHSIGWLFVIILALFIGLRPIHRIFADTVGYANYYNFIKGDLFRYNKEWENPIFDSLTHIMASYSLSCELYFFILAFFYFGFRYISNLKLFPKDCWGTYLMFLGAFITFTSSVNGIKAGIACSLLVCAIAYRKKYIISILFLLASWGFHHAMHVCLIAFIIVYFYKNSKIYTFIWFCSLILAILHVTYFQFLFAGFTDEKSVGYLISDNGYHTGMRYDFVLYSSAPLLLARWYYKKYGVFSDVYRFTLNLYLLLNGVWMLCMYASFTNRIAALSWALIPLLLIFPFIEPNSKDGAITNKTGFTYSMLGQLSFTLFMNLIYYGMIK